MGMGIHLAGAATAAQEQHQDVEHKHDRAVHLRKRHTLVNLKLTILGAWTATLASSQHGRAGAERKAAASFQLARQQAQVAEKARVQMGDGATHDDSGLAQVEAGPVLAEGRRPPVL